MSTIFTLLFLVSLFVLVVGLIKPSALSVVFKSVPSRKKVGWIFGLATLGFMILMSVASPAAPSPSVQTEQQKVAAIFDVPALLGKDINQIRTSLGVPNKDDSEPTILQMQMGVTEWYKSYEKDGQELLITYNPRTKKVIDFFLPTDSQNKAALLARGNLKEGDPGYRIEFVKMLKDPSRFTGVKVMPN